MPIDKQTNKCELFDSDFLKISKEKVWHMPLAQTFPFQMTLSICYCTQYTWMRLSKYKYIQRLLLTIKAMNSEHKKSKNTTLMLQLHCRVRLRGCLVLVKGAAVSTYTHTSSTTALQHLLLIYAMQCRLAIRFVESPRKMACNIHRVTLRQLKRVAHLDIDSTQDLQIYLTFKKYIVLRPKLKCQT